MDKAIHWINLYLVDNIFDFPNTYPMDVDLFGGELTCVAGRIVVPGVLFWRRSRHAKRAARLPHFLSVLNAAHFGILKPFASLIEQ